MIHKSFHFLTTVFASAVLLFLISQTTGAQSNFVSSYVLLKTGDTLKGYINDQEWKVNPKSVQFKTTKSEKEKVYTPLDIPSFRIAKGDWYFSFVGMVDHSSWLVSELKYESAPDTVKDTLFVRALVMGRANLFYSFDKIQRDHFFIQKDNGPISELFYTKFLKHPENGPEIIVGNSGPSIFANSQYKLQVVKAFGDCDAIISTIMKTSLTYSVKDLENIFKRYNDCNSNTTVYIEAKEKWKFEPMVLAGINYSSLHFTSTDFSFNDVNFNGQLGYAFGIALNSVIPRNRQKFSLYTELLVKNFNGTGTGTAPTNPGIPEKTSDIVMNLIYAKLNLMVRYQMIGRSVRPLFEIGISNGLAVKHDNYVLEADGTHTTFLPDFRTYEQGLIFGSGVRSRKFELEGRLEFSNGMSTSHNLHTSFTTLYVIVGYAF